MIQRDMDRSRRWVKGSKTPKQELDLPIKYRTKNQCVFTDQIVKYKWRMSLPYSPLLEFQVHFQWNAKIFSIKWTKLWLKIGSRKNSTHSIGLTLAGRGNILSSANILSKDHNQIVIYTKPFTTNNSDEDYISTQTPNNHSYHFTQLNTRWECLTEINAAAKEAICYHFVIYLLNTEIYYLRFIY